MMTRTDSDEVAHHVRLEIDKELERYKAELAGRARHYEETLVRQRLEWQELQESGRIGQRGVLEFAFLVIRSLFIANGGAVLSLLTFIGNMQAKAASLGALASAMVPLSNAMPWFVGGVVAALFTGAAAYSAQVAFVELPQGARRPAVVVGNILRLVSVAAGLGSLVSFVVGSLKCATAFIAIAAV